MSQAAFSLSLIFVLVGSFGHIVAAQPSPEEIIIEKIKPAVVYVQIKHKATIVTPPYTITKELSVVPAAGTQQRALEGQQTISYWARGSGFIITPDGYIITNAHVAAPSQEEKIGTLAYYWAYYEYRELKELVETETKQSISTELENQIRSSLKSYAVTQANWNTIKIETKLYAWFGGVTTGEETVTKGCLADLRKAGEVVFEGSGKDIAILKIEKKNLPTVRLGDSDMVRVGESVIQIGYPASSADRYFTEETEYLVPSTTKGIVSAIKPMKEGGYKTIQHDAQASPGGSGGPLFNTKGEVIGIYTWFGTTSRTGEIVQNFAVPINLAKQFLNEINVKPEVGEVDTHWSRGIDLYHQHRYSDAINEFNRVKELNPAFFYADEYITSAREAIYRGEDIKGFEIGGAFIRDIYMYGIIAIIAIAILVSIFIFKRPTALRLPITARAAPKVEAKPREEVPPVSGDVCTKCGAPIKSGDSFCRSCGTKYSR